MEIPEYFGSLQRKCGELSVSADDLGVEVQAEGRAKIEGRVTFNERAYLRVSETVEVREGTVHRAKASYYFIADRTERWGHDLDPTHDAVEHVHRGAAHERVEGAPCPTFPRAIERAWETTSEEAESEGI